MASKMQLDFNLLVVIEMTVIKKNKDNRNTRESFDSQALGDYYCCSFFTSKMNFTSLFVFSSLATPD